MAEKILSVDQNSPAARAGIRAGEVIIAIDGTPIRDVLDYKFYSYDSKIDVRLIDEQEQVRQISVKKREGEPLGINFEQYLMDRMKQCSNKCVFCFIDQLPKGMRETLYVKDDDARMSFLLGNYITMTNLSEQDIDRIVRMHISPINVSVHTTNPELRVKMLGNRRARDLLGIMQRLAAHDIKMNCQIVVCNGLNDGKELVQSLADLKAMYPAVNTVSIVPFGMTAHRENLFELLPTTKQSAADVLDIVEAAADACLKEFGTRVFWCGDELYLKAERPIPDSQYYEDYTQFENGIGMIAMFEEEFGFALPDFIAQPARPFTIATGEAAAPMMRKLLSRLQAQNPDVQGQVVAVQNRFFGPLVSVAGLITGSDLKEQLAGKELGERVLISVNMLRDGGDVFLDDMTPIQVEQAIGVPLVTVDIDGADLLDKIFEATAPC